MHSTLNPKQTDDPRDVLVIAPDVVLVAPTDEELSRLAHSLRHPSNPQMPAGPDLPPEPTVPPVDTTFRPAAVGDVRLPGHRPSIGGRAVRAFTAAILLAACAGAAAVGWQSYGDAAEQMIMQWAPPRVLASLLPAEKPALIAQPAPPAVETAAADAAPAQPASPAESAPEVAAPVAAAPSAETVSSLGSTANDIASMRQEIQQLRASVEQLKASQQQMSREIAKASEPKASEAKASEQNLRPKMSAPPPRSVAARSRRPMPPLAPPQAAAAPVLPQAAPYVPRPPEPQPLATT